MACLLSGCKTAAPIDPGIQAAGEEPLICVGGEQCSVYWRRAQVWVASNSAWKIQTVTDALIQTYGAPTGNMNRAFQVTREPQGDGKERIRIGSACGNMFGCYTHELEEAAKLKTYVKAVLP